MVIRVRLPLGHLRVSTNSPSSACQGHPRCCPIVSWKLLLLLIAARASDSFDEGKASPLLALSVVRAAPLSSPSHRARGGAVVLWGSY